MMVTDAIICTCQLLLATLQEGKEIMTVARLNSRIQGMTPCDRAASGPGSPASQSTAGPCLNPSPALSVQVSSPPRACWSRENYVDNCAAEMCPL